MKLKSHLKKKEVSTDKMKLTRRYALFTKDVKSKDKYQITTPPKIFFTSRNSANRFIKRFKITDAKVLRY